MANSKDAKPDDSMHRREGDERRYLTDKELDTVESRQPLGASPIELRCLLAEIRDARIIEYDRIGVAGLPRVLYHYCSSEAFYGIINSKQIWLTDSRTTNDSQENDWAHRKLLEGIQKSCPEQERSVLQRMLVQAMAPPVIACFSALRDSLGQWRSYAGDGTGLAVGINPAKLGIETDLPNCEVNEPTLGSLMINRPAAIFHMVYNPEAQALVVDRLCTQFRERLVSAGGDTLAQDKARWELLCGVLTARLCFKHPGFEEEREWRVTGREHLRVRDEGVERAIKRPRQVLRRGRLVHVTPHSLVDAHGGCAIERVLIGPCAAVTVEEIRHLLEESGLKAIEIEKSSIPYRLV